jgi:hypothetical protein
MTMTEQEAQREQWLDDLYAEHKEQAIEEFTTDRLQSYYLKNPLLAEPSIRALAQARDLLSLNPSASLVFATIAIEVGLKVVLLKPIVHGLVHSESAAGLIAELSIGHTSVDKFRNLLFQLLLEHGGIDLKNFCREGSKEKLWEEMGEVQKKRNAILHRGEVFANDDAGRAIEVASAILKNLFPTLITKLGFHLHDDVRICNDWRCTSSFYRESLKGNKNG